MGSIWTATRSFIGNSRCLKGVLQMTRPGPRRKEYHVEPQRRGREPGVAAEIVLGRADQPALVHLAHRLPGALPPATRLHFDEHRSTEALGDQIDLAARRFEAAGDDAVELRLQEQRGQRLAAAALSFGGEAPLI